MPRWRPSRERHKASGRAAQELIAGKTRRPRVRDDHSFLIYLAHVLYWSGSYICASNFVAPFLQRLFMKHGFEETEAWFWASDCYNGLIILLLVASWLASGTVTVVDVVASVICLGRLFELYMVVLRIVVSDPSPSFQAPVPIPVHTQESTVRQILLVPVYLAQLTLIFAVLFQTLAHGQVVDTVSGTPKPIEGAMTFLYLSWTTLTTLGSGFTFTTTSPRLLAMVEVGSGLAIITVMLSAFLGSFRLTPPSDTL